VTVRAKTGVPKADVPRGFKKLFRSSPFLDLIGPLYYKPRKSGFIVALRAAEKHCNARGLVHGGVLMTLADIALGYRLATQENPPAALSTASLTADFVGTAKCGDWIEAHVDIQKLGGRLAFANAYIVCDGNRIARASGVFARLKAEK